MVFDLDIGFQALVTDGPFKPKKCSFLLEYLSQSCSWPGSRLALATQLLAGEPSARLWTPSRASVEPGCWAFYSIFAIKPGIEILSFGSWAGAHSNLDAVAGRQDACLRRGQLTSLSTAGDSCFISVEEGSRQSTPPSPARLAGRQTKQRCMRTTSFEELRDWSEKCHIDAAQLGSRKWG